MEMLTISKDDGEEQIKGSESVECKWQKPPENSTLLASPPIENHNGSSNTGVRVQVVANDWIDRLSALQRHILYIHSVQAHLQY